MTESAARTASEASSAPEITPAPETPGRVIHPLVMVDDRKILPRDYIIHKRSQRCLNCGTIHEWSDVYARNELPPLHNLGHYVNNLVPIQGFRFNLPVRVVSIEARCVPACHECFDSLSLQHLPDPRESEEWKAIVKRKQAQAEAAALKAEAKGRTPAHAKAKPSLDSMKDLF